MNKTAQIYTVSDWRDSEEVCRRYAYEAGLLRQEVRRWKETATFRFWEGLAIGIMIGAILMLSWPDTRSMTMEESTSMEGKSSASEASAIPLANISIGIRA